MQEVNPYAAPTAPLSEAMPKLALTRHFVVAERKLLVMYLGTCGLYGFYWMYQHWAHLKRVANYSVWPVPRSLFSIFYYHALFREIDQTLTRSGRRLPWPHDGLATGVVAVTLLARVTDRLAVKEIGSPITDCIGLVAIVIIAWLLTRAQRMANLACDDPNGSLNARIGVANVLWILLGLVIWLLLLVGLLIAFGAIAPN